MACHWSIGKDFLNYHIPFHLLLSFLSYPWNETFTISAKLFIVLVAALSIFYDVRLVWMRQQSHGVCMWRGWRWRMSGRILSYNSPWTFKSWWCQGSWAAAEGHGCGGWGRQGGQGQSDRRRGGTQGQQGSETRGGDHSWESCCSSGITFLPTQPPLYLIYFFELDIVVM